MPGNSNVKPIHMKKCSKQKLYWRSPDIVQVYVQYIRKQKDEDKEVIYLISTILTNKDCFLNVWETNRVLPISNKVIYHS